MITFDPDAFLGTFAATRPKLCFYPSCGAKLLWAVMKLDADIFVFSDKGYGNPSSRRLFWLEVQKDFRANGLDPRLYKATTSTRVFQCSGKWAFVFFQDNNDVLRRIVRAGHQLGLFVGIRDGCSEGGNYECVHNNPFLSRVLEASADEFSYFSDHSSVLQDDRRRGHTSFRPTYSNDSGWVFSLLAVLVIRTGHSPPLQIDDLEVFCPQNERNGVTCQWRRKSRPFWRQRGSQ